MGMEQQTRREIGSILILFLQIKNTSNFMENVMAKNNTKSKNCNTTKVQKQTITCPYCFAQAEKITCENSNYLEMLGRLIRPDEDNVYLCKNCLRIKIEKGMKDKDGKEEIVRDSRCPCGTGFKRCCLNE
jgi:hypothetical protein